MKKIYLFLAIAGAVVPYWFFAHHFAQSGLDLLLFVQAVFGNDAAAGFAADLIISSIVFWVFMFARRGRGQGPKPTFFILLNLTIGLSCALPAYLYASGESAG